MSILQQICEERRAAVKAQRIRQPITSFRESALYTAPTRSLKRALKNAALGIIAEHKRASPSQGNYGCTIDPVDVAIGYEKAGATAISVLTEPNHFGGDLDHLKAIRKAVDLPLLRKDFTVDPYQLHEAKAAGADAILLIAAALSIDEANELRTVAYHLGLEVLLEIHDTHELDYLSIEPDIVGVNNRNLKTMEISLATSEALITALPKEMMRISESGIRNAADAARMYAIGFDGLLVGTQFMQTKDPVNALDLFRSEIMNLRTANA